MPKPPKSESGPKSGERCALNPQASPDPSDDARRKDERCVLRELPRIGDEATRWRANGEYQRPVPATAEGRASVKHSRRTAPPVTVGL
jgi:hypothetical protein